MSYLWSNPAIPSTRNFAFFMVFFSGSIEYPQAVRKSTFSSIVFSNIARLRSHVSKTDPLSSALVKFTSWSVEFLNRVFLILSPKKEERFNIHVSKDMELRNLLQFSKFTPKSLESINRTFINSVPRIFMRLRLQLLNVHSIKMTSERFTPEKSHRLKVQFS